MNLRALLIGSSMALSGAMAQQPNVCRAVESVITHVNQAGNPALTDTQYADAVYINRKNGGTVVHVTYGPGEKLETVLSGTAFELKHGAVFECPLPARPPPPVCVPQRIPESDKQSGDLIIGGPFALTSLRLSSSDASVHPVIEKILVDGAVVAQPMTDLWSGAEIVVLPGKVLTIGIKGAADRKAVEVAYGGYRLTMCP